MVSEREWRDYIEQYPGRPHFRDRPVSVVSIFRVPKFLKDTKKEAYVPQRVSLGPYHHGSAELPPMGHHKGRALCRMMKRFNAKNRPDDPNDMYLAVSARAEILQLEKDIRDNYEDDVDYDGETLSRMLCLDGCFLLEVLRILCGEKDSIADAENCYDPILGKDKLLYAAPDIWTDILTLENQIPLIVLLKLLELELGWVFDAEERLKILMERLSRVLLPFGNINFDREQCCRHHHLLDFLHTVITSPPSSSQGEHVNRVHPPSSSQGEHVDRVHPPSSSQGESVDQRECIISIGCCCRQCISMLQCRRKARNDAEGIPHAVELRNAGIKYSPIEGGCIKQIKFDENSATICLPPIRVSDFTERVLRNLIAYEMCKPFDINYVSHYVALMDDLIDTEQYVALMRRMGVLQNGLGSDKEIADLFNGLCKEVTMRGEDVFDNLAKKVHAYYNNKIMVQIGKLVHDHFSSPWTALALTAAIVMLLLTLPQTIFTIK